MFYVYCRAHKKISKKRRICVEVTYGLNNQKIGRVVAWHEDATQKGNFVLTIETSTGTVIHSVEKKLSEKQEEELKRIVPKDDTGL